MKNLILEDADEKAKEKLKPLSELTVGEVGITEEIPDADAQFAREVGEGGDGEGGGKGGGKGAGKGASMDLEGGGSGASRGLDLFDGGSSSSSSGKAGTGKRMTADEFRKSLEAPDPNSELRNTSIQQYVEMQDNELKKSISKLTEARMIAHAYMRMIEERTEIIRSLESEIERGRMKQIINAHPAGEVMLPYALV